MKYYRFSLTVITFLTFFAISACGGTEQDRVKTKESSETQQKEEKSIYISEEGLDKKLNSDDKFYLIDVREIFEFANGHIENAYHIPVGIIGTEITKRIPEIKKDDEIVLYCHTKNRSTRSYRILDALGYTNVRVMQGGWSGWFNYISDK